MVRFGQRVRTRSGGDVMLVVDVLADGLFVCAWRDDELGLVEVTFSAVCLEPA